MLIIHSSLSVFVFNRFNLAFPILELYLTNFPLTHTHAHARTHKHIHSHILYATHACTPKIHKQTRTHSHMFDIQHHLSLSLPSLYLRADRIFRIYVMTDTRSDAAWPAQPLLYCMISNSHTHTREHQHTHAQHPHIRNTPMAPTNAERLCRRWHRRLRPELCAGPSSIGRPIPTSSTCSANGIHKPRRRRRRQRRPRSSAGSRPRHRHQHQHRRCARRTVQRRGAYASAPAGRSAAAVGRRRPADDHRQSEPAPVPQSGQLSGRTAAGAAQSQESGLDAVGGLRAHNGHARSSHKCEVPKRCCPIVWNMYLD